MIPYEWTTLLENVGFPGAVTLYLLVRYEKKMDRLSSQIHAWRNEKKKKEKKK
ncbi:MAG: YvrJ family protein [Alkalicoccus sp.]|jgi:hypothetical protein|uniref:YvrJ family protein n=1 Tax=Alkalicoccus saliphilus TaxID=200989 RepID=A0A2T4U5V1_9BACI|nr:YvrJ family protein [Alkalicoccus saliphilus]PTL38788.1 YvrJ family protein [Alkalicoccus saliphilus]TVP84712.1 MAG: YvrJ family protein [Alkalicoccus sp.]